MDVLASVFKLSIVVSSSVVAVVLSGISVVVGVVEQNRVDTSKYSFFVSLR